MELSPGNSNSPPEAHSMLCGRFELMREEPANTGVQLFGPTLAVLDTHTGEPARACVLDAALLPTPEARAAFVRELGEFAELQESALVPQVFVGEDGERVVVCYDPLQGAFALRDMDDGPRSSDLANELQRLARQLARALATLHAHGRVHGMLAGEAVFVGPRGPAAFQHGFAPLCARAELERRWSGVDPALLAPEVLAGGAFTPAADAYAWGVALAEFATGLRGAAALRAPEPPGLQPGLWALIGASVADDPAARPRDGADLVRRLEALALAGTAEAAEPPSLATALASPPSLATALASPPSLATTLASPPSLATALASPPPTSEPPAVAKPPVPPDLSDSPVPPPPVSAASASEPIEEPITSLEDLLFGEGSIRPGTVSALRPSTVPPGTWPAAGSSGAAAISGVQAQEGSGRSNSGLRRVHVLTEDSIVRRSPISRPDIVVEPSGDSTPAAARSDARESSPAEPPAEPATAPAVPHPPTATAASAAKTPAPPPKPLEVLPAPQRSDRSFWLVIVALLVAVALAWAFT